MDEKSMILEQERQEKAKKRKKYKKLKIAAGVFGVLLLAGGIFYVVKGRELLAASQTKTVEIVAEEGQTIVYARIVSIYGNEITYVETQMPQISVSDENQGERSEGDRGQMPEGFGGGMPEGFGGRNDSQQSSEQITAYIPVGTDVITKLGTITTFSRLAAGDYVALVMEEENGEQVIMAVYIVG